MDPNCEDIRNESPVARVKRTFEAFYGLTKTLIGTRTMFDTIDEVKEAVDELDDAFPPTTSVGQQQQLLELQRKLDEMEAHEEKRKEEIAKLKTLKLVIDRQNREIIELEQRVDVAKEKASEAKGKEVGALHHAREQQHIIERQQRELAILKERLRKIEEFLQA